MHALLRARGRGPLRRPRARRGVRPQNARRDARAPPPDTRRPPLRGDLARFSLAEAPQGQGASPRPSTANAATSALPDTASKIAFALRHKHGSPLAIGDILAVAAGAVS